MKFDPNLLCPLCGQNTPENNGKKWISREHIPPRSLFINPPKNLITIPCCKECNHGSSKHDLDFKIALGLYIGNESPEFWGNTVESLNKSDVRKKKKHALLDNASKLLHKTPAGWWGYRITFDEKPIKIVVKKIVKGLHWHLSKNIVTENDANFTIKYLQQGERVKPEIQEILEHYGQILSLGNSFQTQYAIAEDNKYGSIWKLTFYGKDCFIVIIDPKTKNRLPKPS